MNDCQSKLQILLDVTEYYGQTYNVNYSAVKSKVTVVGAAEFRKYFAQWQTVHNNRLDQIKSVVDQEMKNLDLRIKKGRNSLFPLLGLSFQSKCHLSLLLKTYISPIIRSGSFLFSLRTNHLKPLTIFHRKILRGILNLSKSSNIPALYFLFGWNAHWWSDT